jgi:flagellar assembly protein FliH
VEAWLMPDFDTPQLAAMPEAPAGAAASPDAAALAQITHEAAQAGFAQGHHEGFDAGFAAGRAEGLAAGQTEINQMQHRLQGWLQHLANPLAELDREVEIQMARLATQMARALIYRELTLKPEQIDLVAQAAIAALPLAVRHITVLCHPQEVDALRSAIHAGTLNLHGKGEIHVQGDEAVAAGGLRVESGTVGIQAQVDATLESRWATLCLRTLGELAPGPGDALPELAEKKFEQKPEQEPSQPTALEGDVNRAATPPKTPPTAGATPQTATDVAT